MADEKKFVHKPAATLRCEEWEALLADALDGLLPAKDAAAFAAHSESCANCGDLLGHAQRGREWLGYLHDEPEAPAGLVAKILEKTAGPGAVPMPVIAGAAQGPGAMAMPWRRSFHETRLLMTVAMAFFSIALTLNLVGFKLTSFRLADLRPSQLGGTISRQFYAGWGSVVKFYDNARFVYQLESRVRELRRDVEQQQPARQQPPATQKKQEPSKQGGGSSKAVPERGALLNASQSRVAEDGLQPAGESAELIAQSGQRSEEETSHEAESKEEKAAGVVNGLVGSVISLDQQRAGLQDGYDRRSLV